MSTVSWNARDQLGRVIEVTSDTVADVPSPGPETLATGTASTVVTDDTDPGAIGAGNMWLREDPITGIYSLLVRNATDDGWNTVGLVHHNVSGEPTAQLVASADSAGMTVTDTGGNGRASIVASAHPSIETVRSIALTVFDNAFAEYAALLLDSTGVHIGSTAAGPTLKAGTADPSAGGGVVAPEGSLYMRTTDTAGQLWIKTGDGATAWTRVATV